LIIIYKPIDNACIAILIIIELYLYTLLFHLHGLNAFE